MTYGYNVLPAINEESVMAEAKQILLAEADVNDVDIIRRILEEDDIQRQLPELVSTVRQLSDSRGARMSEMITQVEDWRRTLAQEALAVLTDEQRATAVSNLRERASGPDENGLKAKMSEIVDNALALVAPSEDGRPQVTLIPSSALGILEDLEDHTNMGYSYEVGNADHVPMAMTVCEIVEHCAKTTGASEAEEAWAVRHLAKTVCGDEFDPEFDPRHLLERFTNSSGAKHDEWVKTLKDIRQELLR